MTEQMVAIEDYKNAEYKTQLTAYEYNDIISTAISGIIDLYDKGIYGFNTFTLNSSLVSVCTNIDMSINDPDAKTRLFEETDVIDNIIRHIGEQTYNRILSETDLGLRYRISTNPETKELLRELGNLAKNLGDVSHNVTDETLNSLMSSVKSAIATVPKNENK